MKTRSLRPAGLKILLPCLLALASCWQPSSRAQDATRKEPRADKAEQPSDDAKPDDAKPDDAKPDDAKPDAVEPAGEIPGEERPPEGETPATNDPPAADETAPQPGTPVGDPELVKLFLMDGSVISGKLSLTLIEVQTDFGSLSVPVTSLRSFTPGLGSHPEMGKKLDDLIEALGTGDFSERELAQKTLIKMGTSIKGQLEQYESDPDNERRTRVKAVLNELEQISEDEEESEEGPESSGIQVAMIQRDTVETTEFTMIGKIVPQVFEITSLYGPLTVKIENIRRAQREFVAGKQEIRKSIKLTGTHLVQSDGNDTHIHLERGDQVSITAEGTMTMTPWGNQAVSTPDGAPMYGWYTANDIASGTLVARVGGKGRWFRVGSKHTFKADRAGNLQLAIAMQQEYANQNFPANYSVKLRVKPK